MTAFGRAIMFFTPSLLALVMADVLWLIWEPGPVKASLIPFLLYVAPPLAFRLHDLAYPLRSGVHRLDTFEYSPWWGGHQIQQLYFVLPQLEALLRVVPGAYSAWLRLWGSRIGKGVHWAATVTVGDRSSLRVGDRAVFGHHVEIWSHLIKTKNGRVVLFAKESEIGADAFVSGYVRIGPGSKIQNGAWVPAGTDVYPNKSDARPAVDRRFGIHA